MGGGDDDDDDEPNAEPPAVAAAKVGGLFAPIAPELVRSGTSSSLVLADKDA
jgi:hypothetical protein